MDQTEEEEEAMKSAAQVFPTCGSLSFPFLLQSVPSGCLLTFDDIKLHKAPKQVVFKNKNMTKPFPTL